MLIKRIWISAVVLLLVAAIGNAAGLTNTEKLGKEIFFDKELSKNKNQACSSCHAKEVGFTGPDSIINVMGSVYEGSVAGRFGNRKPPACAYAGNSTILSQNNTSLLWSGGMFWDGRATGWTLGDPLAEQAKGPFLNPMEQGLPDAACVVHVVVTSDYKNLYKKVWGELKINWSKNVCSNVSVLSDSDQMKVNGAYDNIARSIAAYERSKEVSSYTSRYDSYLEGKATLTDQEMRGLELFNNKTTAKCANCHVPPLFTDFTYDNLGIPKNPMNPFYYEKMWNGLGGGLNWIDYGFGGFLNSTQYNQSELENNGKHKVPTLRNVDKRPYPDFIKAYGHNGYFKSLEQIVHFYNTRDVLNASWNGEKWPAPEVSDNINTAEVGNLSLSVSEEEDIVAFLKTLTDKDHHDDDDDDGDHDKDGRDN